MLFAYCILEIWKILLELFCTLLSKDHFPHYINEKGEDLKSLMTFPKIHTCIQKFIYAFQIWSQGLPIFRIVVFKINVFPKQLRVFINLLQFMPILPAKNEIINLFLYRWSRLFFLPIQNVGHSPISRFYFFL